MKFGNFYTVSTPIGNLKDLSNRAIETLSNVDIIACEDKRVSVVLLNNFNISKPMLVYQKHNEQKATSEIIDLLSSGKNVALISDAGAPCISDPGKIIVTKLFEHGIRTTNIPGACAITTILACSPRIDEEFAFSGFLPRTISEQKKIFEKYKNIDLVFYESPKRLLETLENIKKFRGENQKITIGRELTKKFEEVIYKSISEMISYFQNGMLKGEIVGILYKSENKEQNNYEDKIKKLLRENYSAKDISTIIATLYSANKKEVYSKAVEMKNSN